MSEEDGRTQARVPLVAIDGPAGAGKSTLAQAVAAELGLPYINTGLMYRALARRALDAGVDPADGPTLASLAGAMRFVLDARTGVTIDGAEPGPELAAEDVERVVSTVAAHPGVRAVLRERQRELGKGGGVMEGRDIGSVVFPDADVKIFLQAEPDVRVGRRVRERGRTSGEAVRSRDSTDAATNPLRPSPGARVLDSSRLSREEMLEEGLRLVREAVPARAPVSARTGGPPVVVLVGRQNVGKSTLANRLSGRRTAISDPSPGVTRDRVDLRASWGGRTFVLVDTGGYTRDPSELERKAAGQAGRAMGAADLRVLVVDVSVGIQEEDAALADMLRRSDRPVLVVANKVDSEVQAPSVAEFHALGLGEPIPVSALHGRGSSDLLDRILDLIPEDAGPEPQDEARICLIGRPNVGKSSLFNRLVGEDRAVVHEVPGTTRDAVDLVVRVHGHDVRFIDTAGLRRPVKTQGVEYYSLVRSLRAIASAQVALLVVDAHEGLTGEDKRIAARVAEAGRGLVAVLNKWDLVPSEELAIRFRELSSALRIFPGTPVLRASALTGSGVHRVPPALLVVHTAWTRRVATAEVNRILADATAAHPPPRGTGRILYGTQVSAGPPSFVLFGAPEAPAAYRRYLESSLRRAFGFDGVPIRLAIRGRHSGPAASSRRRRIHPDR